MDPRRRSDELTVLSVGLAFGLLHLPFSLGLAVTLAFHGSFVQTVLLLLYPVALALTGVGAALAGVSPWLAAGRGSLRVAGVAALAFLAASLWLNFLTSELWALVAAAIAHFGALGAWFLALGAALAGALARLRAEGRVGRAWAVHLAGLVVGYAVSEPMVVAVGLNAALLAVGLCFVVFGRAWAIALPVAVGLGLVASPDAWLEDTRALEVWQDEDEQVVFGREAGWKDERAAALHAAGKRRVWLGWSRYGQVQVLPVNNSNKYTVLYNYKPQYDVCPGCDERERFEAAWDRGEVPSTGDRLGGQRAPLRAALYRLLPAEGRLLFSGVGGGRGLDMLPFALHPGVVAVERDAGAMRLFTRERPELNEGRFLAVTALVADGRHAVEVARERFDAIVLESSRYQPSHSMLPASAPYHLYTREAIRAFVSQLLPGGLLVVELTRATEKPDHRYVPIQILQTLEEDGVEHAVLRTGTLDTVHILACAREGCLRPWLDAVDLSGLPDTSVGIDLEPLVTDYRLTDDTPFVTWATMGSPERARMLLVAGALFGLAAAGWNAAGWFFALGVAHATLQIHAMYAWWAYFGDELLTILRVIVWFLIYGAVGSALAGRLSPRLAGWGARVGVAAALLAVHAAGVALIPFEESAAWARELYAAAALLPGGLLMGALMPLGLAGASADRVGRNLCADALGTLAGYAGMYLVLLPAGMTAYGAVGVALYLGVAAGLRPPAASG